MTNKLLILLLVVTGAIVVLLGAILVVLLSPVASVAPTSPSAPSVPLSVSTPQGQSCYDGIGKWMSVAIPILNELSNPITGTAILAQEQKGQALLPYIQLMRRSKTKIEETPAPACMASERVIIVSSLEDFIQWHITAMNEGRSPSYYLDELGRDTKRIAQALTSIRVLLP